MRGKFIKIGLLILFLLIIVCLFYLLSWQEYKNEIFGFKIIYPNFTKMSARSKEVIFSNSIYDLKFEINYSKYNPNNDNPCIDEIDNSFGCKDDEDLYFTDKNSAIFGYGPGSSLFGVDPSLKKEIMLKNYKGMEYKTNCNTSQVGRMPCVPTILIVINEDEKQYRIEFDNIENLGKNELKILDSFIILK